MNWGSGYPGDPATKAFLEKNVDPVFGYPTFVRFSWKTCVNNLEGRVRVQWPEDTKRDQANLKKMFEK